VERVQLGVYITLNPVNPDLLARGVNRVREFVKATTTDVDVLHRRWLLIDCDPVRPSDISATDDEHAQALERVRTVQTWLAGFGMTAPLVADSGNGAHLLLRVDLPNDPASLALLTQVLAALDFRFSDGTVSIDQKTVNAARISKLYGTLVSKGDSTPARPHRLAAILEEPLVADVCSRESLERIAALAPAPPRPVSGDGRDSFDLDAFLARHEDRLHVSRTGPWQNGQKWILSPCPWDESHTNEAAFILRFQSGAIAAGCHHNSCRGRDWHALRDLLEPGRMRHARLNGSALPPRVAAVRPEQVEPAADSGQGLIITRLADVTPQPVTWLWRGRIPLGKLTVGAGDPGLGKSLLGIDLSARITLGAPLPGSDAAGPAGDVILLSAEDGAADTIRPRFDVAGGDASRVHLVEAVNDGGSERPFTLAQDLSLLEPVVAERRPRLLIIDPLSAYLGDRDSYKDSDVRALLAPLAALADRYQMAVLAIVHLGKNEQRRALYRALGSIAFVAAARSMLAVAQDPDDKGRRLVAGGKANLSGEAAGLAYRVIGVCPTCGLHVSDGLECRGCGVQSVAKLVWEDTPVPGLDADRLLGAQSTPDERDEAHDAEAFLRSLLNSRDVPAKEGEQAARAHGIAPRTLDRARRRVGVRAYSIGFKPKVWWWTLSPDDHAPPPADSPKDATKDAKYQTVASFEQPSAEKDETARSSSKDATLPTLASYGGVLRDSGVLRDGAEPPKVAVDEVDL
jgi:AAA domain